jgi:hypothetical protein
MLERVQRGLELLYRIETDLDVRDFVLSEASRDAFAPARAAREQLLVAEREGELELGLFVDERALANLAANDPHARLDDGNLGDFLITVEGVSHFVYLAWNARRRRPVSVLELELQAEIDKYVTCVLMLWPDVGALRPRLFDAVVIDPACDALERERYLVANSNARAYAARLDARYLARGQLGGLIDELRRFYRLGGADKLACISG